MEITVISDPEAARTLRRHADAGRTPVVHEGRCLGAAGRSAESAAALARRELGRDDVTVRRADVACLWLGDHPPRAARKVSAPGDKRPYVAVTAWLVETGRG